MECVRQGVLCFVLVTLALSLPVSVHSWQTEWEPSTTIELDDGNPTVKKFTGHGVEDDFRMMLAEDESSTMLVAGRNVLYNISMITLEKTAEIEWTAGQTDVGTCKMNDKSIEQCQNYIRVLLKTSPDNLFVCGTNAFNPICRNYGQTEDGTYVKKGKDIRGTALCPFNPTHNNTMIYADGKMYSATVADFSSRDPLILESTEMVRTEQYDSRWLNEPNFVSSFEMEDKVYFFFRETAVENINCGKAVFSRVGRVCKKDMGGKMILIKQFTSFFKARLNCSIPGDFPFYFDEIQATSEMGRGNYRPTYDSGDRYDMVYGVFNTPPNSIHGSAVCAFRYSDIQRTFEGRFKGQESFLHSWLAVAKEKTPKPHPQQCTDDTHKLLDTTLGFIKNHPLMDESVPAAGGGPLLLHTSFKAQFTKIAVDWMVRAADDRYYDVMYVGTDDGRVIKAVNKGSSSKIETVVIEDIRVFGHHDPITGIKVFRDRAKGVEKLIAVSRGHVVSIPLHRCHQARTCRTCVELRDPYCAWDGSSCVNAERGIQNVMDGWRSGWDRDCEEVTIYDETKKRKKAEDEKTPSEPKDEKCDCPTVYDADAAPSSVEEDLESLVVVEGQNTKYDKTGRSRNGGPRVGLSAEEEEPAAVNAASVETLAIAIVVSIVLSMLVGFFIGYKVAGCRGNRDSDASYMERTCSLQRSRNRLSSGEHPYYNPEHAIIPKQMNYVVNVKGKLNTSSVETKPVTKSNKVYL